MAVSGVVLAAGPSTRFSGPIPKQLVKIAGVPLTRRAAVAALESKLAEVIVVVGYRADLVGRALHDLPVQIVNNERFAAGQSTSVMSGLRAVASSSSGAMFIPADQPDLGPDSLDLLIDAHEASEFRITVPCHQGVRGAPVIFDRSLFGELLALRGDAGGRQLFAAHEGDLTEVELESDKPLFDIDTREDLRGHEKGAGSSG